MTGVLRARVNGAWVDVAGGTAGGGTDEVWIGTDDPIAANPTIELWYDSDDDAQAVDSANYWNSSWGRIGYAQLLSDQGVGTSATTIMTFNATLVGGRRYRLQGDGWLSKDGSSATSVTLLCIDNSNVQQTNITTAANQAVVWRDTLDFDTSQVNAGFHSFQVKIYTTIGNITASAAAGRPSSMSLDDIGPMTKAAVNPPAGQPQIATAGNALGLVAYATMANYTGQAIPSNVATPIASTITYSTALGRRYRVRGAVRALSPSGSAVGVQMIIGGSVTQGSNQTMAWVAGAYTALSAEVIVNGTGNSETFTLTATPINASVNIWSDQAASYFYLEDIGPNQAPALPIPDTPPGWMPATLMGTWTNYGSGWNVAQYRKIGDEVALRGLIGNTTSQTGTINILTLPAGFRPALNYMWQVPCAIPGATSMRCDVQPNGVVCAQLGALAAAPMNFLSLDVIKFSVTA